MKIFKQSIELRVLEDDEKDDLLRKTSSYLFIDNESKEVVALLLISSIDKEHYIHHEFMEEIAKKYIETFLFDSCINLGHGHHTEKEKSLYKCEHAGLVNGKLAYAIIKKLN